MNMNFIRTNIQSCKTCYNKENDSSKCLGCVTYGDDISDFKLKPEIDEYLSEIELKAIVYDTKEVQDAIECDRIEKILLERTQCVNVKTLSFSCRVTIGMSEDKKEFFGETKLEALTKALEWVEGRV